MSGATPITHRKAILKFFITFPKSQGVSRNDFFDQIDMTFPIEKCLISQEPHKDGTPHLHAAVVFKTAITKYQLIQEMMLAYPDEYKRINIQSMRSLTHSITYLTSPDKDKTVDTEPYLFNIDITKESSARHNLFHYQFADETPIYRAEACECPECEIFIRKHYDLEYEELRQFIHIRNLIAEEDIQIV